MTAAALPTCAIVILSRERERVVRDALQQVLALRPAVLAAGGVEEGFVRVACRFEAELSRRWRSGSETIWYETTASLRHPKTAAGRAGASRDPLRTLSPAHAAGKCPGLRGAARPAGRMSGWLRRPWRKTWTPHHAQPAWWMPATLVAGVLGIAWAAWSLLCGARPLSAPTVGAQGAAQPLASR